MRGHCLVWGGGWPVGASGLHQEGGGTCTSAGTHLHPYAGICTCTHARTRTHAQTHAFALAHTHTFGQLHALSHACAFTCLQRHASLAQTRMRPPSLGKSWGVGVEDVGGPELALLLWGSGPVSWSLGGRGLRGGGGEGWVLLRTGS